MISEKRRSRIKTVLIILLSIILLFSSAVLYFIIDDRMIHGSKMYNETNSLIKSGKLIGLDFEQCCDILYIPNYINDKYYAELEQENGVVCGKKGDIDYSYYAMFFAGAGVSGQDYRGRNYLIKLYFNNDVEVVYAELIPTEL